MNNVCSIHYDISSNTDNNTATQQAKVFYHLLDSYGHQAALMYLELVSFLKITFIHLTNLISPKVAEAREAIKAIQEKL